MLPRLARPSALHRARRPWAVVPNRQPRHAPARRAPVAAAAGGDGRGGDDARAKGRKQREVQEYVDALTRGGVKREMAQEVLKQWEGAGQDPKQLRRLFLRQSAVPAVATLVQTLVDTAAAYSIFQSGIFFAAGPEFAGRGILIFLLNALSAYFALGVVFDIATLTTILISALRIGTSIDSFYAALKAIAGPPGAGGATGLAVLDKAQAAVNAVKVAQALDAIARMLESEAAGAPGAARKSQDTLGNLSAYLTLQRAEASGFEPSKVSMSEAEAADLALRFSQYDLNDDGRLDAGEVRAMTDTLGVSLSAEEAAAAIKAMDKNSDGLVEFAEWAEWWAGRKGKK